MTKAARIRPALLAATVFTAACTMQGTDIPSLTGPSGLALSVTVTATPDSINWDGASQAAVVITATGPDGAPQPGVAFRLDMQEDGATQDFGTLSLRTVVTDANGRATATYTAPAWLSGESVTSVVITATAIGSNFQTALSHGAEIRLTRPGTLPPSGTNGPSPRFSFSPTAPTISTEVFFDASASCASSIACTSTAGIVSFDWNFGDGTLRSGQFVTHHFDLPGGYQVRLTVTNDRGVSNSLTQFVSIGAGTRPTPSFVFSPGVPVVGQSVLFDGTTSVAAPGFVISSYAWSFGDGATATGATPSHAFTTAGTYTVVLTVTDSGGQTATTTRAVNVGTGAPFASFVVSPQPPVGTGVALTFDATASAAAPGATISSYTWSFGDGTGSGPSGTPTVAKSYAAVGTYTVTLTVTDNLGRTGVTSQAVRIQ